MLLPDYDLTVVGRRNVARASPGRACLQPDLQKCTESVIRALSALAEVDFGTSAYAMGAAAFWAQRAKPFVVRREPVRNAESEASRTNSRAIGG